MLPGHLEQLDPLSRLAVKHGSDKFGAHLYTPHYHEILRHLRDQPIRLLEIGIGGYDARHAGGSSLRMWADYFPTATIVGLDYHAKEFDLPERISLEQGSQDEKAVLDRLVDRYGAFDVIVDDGSHEPAHILFSFRNLYPRMAKAGIYIVEDTQLSFRLETGGNNAGHDTIFDLGHKLGLAMHCLEGHYTDDEELYRLGRMTSSITTLRNAMVFKRGSNTYPSNLGLDMSSDEVRHVYQQIERAALAGPAPRSALSRIDMNIWGRRHDEAEALAIAAARSYPNDHELLWDLERMMIWAGRPDAVLLIRQIREGRTVAHVES